jgi:hypothetical protein
MHSIDAILTRLPAGFALKPVPSEHYHDMLEILPPVAWTGAGFLLGEPYDHRSCGISGKLRASYSVFVESPNGLTHYEGTHALTEPEWRALAANHAAVEACIKRGAE